ncbi:MAG: YicC family protein [Clostridiales bacterium]|nr:YicC family protein [Clostridiales bacterium]
MYSMTGYGKGEYREGGIELTVELKSVNNRFLDVAVKSPRIFNALEEEIRSRLRQKLSRGHVDVFISYADKREKAKSLYVDLNAARAYVEAAEKLKAEFPALVNDTTVSQLLRSPDVARTEEAQEEDTALQNALFIALDGAVAALKKMRLAEGERLKNDVLSRVDTIKTLRDSIAKRAPLVAEEYRKKLTDRMQEFLGGKVDETRILTEAAIFADKSNIDEELTRLSSHITEFHSICKCEEVGRRLDFLVQEFNRECNTVCSKSSDSLITADALKMKNEIEKIREQIQNLE